MRALMGAVFLLILTAAVCLWCALYTENAVKNLTAASEGEASRLARVWKEKRFYLSLTVNRSLIAECERLIAEMGTLSVDDPFFEKAHSDLLSILSVIREGYGVHFGAVL